MSIIMNLVPGVPSTLLIISFIVIGSIVGAFGVSFVVEDVAAYDHTYSVGFCFEA